LAGPHNLQQVNPSISPQLTRSIVAHQKSGESQTAQCFIYSVGSDVPRARGLLYGNKEVADVFIPTARDIGRPRELSPYSHDVYVNERDDPSCYADGEVLDHVEKGKK
jgi:hypothetical protein